MTPFFLCIDIERDRTVRERTIQLVNTALFE